MSAEPSRFILDLVDSIIDSSGTELENTPERATSDPDERRRVAAIRHLARIARASQESQRHEVTRWGHFELLESLGVGASGEVYRARDTRLQREVALKIYHDRIDGGTKGRLLKEGQSHSQVKDANVVTIYGAEEHEGRVGISMELIHGRTLQELAELGRFAPFSAAEASFIGRELCRALGAVHGSGLTHGDVKASNVMRERGGRIVLMDFSASRPVEERAGASEVVAGTPIYMAPEVLSGSRPTERSDVYSLGVLLFFLVTGRYPVAARSLEELIEAYQKGAHLSLSEARPELPLDFTRAVDRALEPDPSRRMESVGALSRHLAGKSGDSDVLFDRLVTALVAAVRGLGKAATSIGASARLLGKVGLYGAVVAGILAVLGFLTTMAYNVALGLDEFGFAPEAGFFDYVRWGARSLVLPAFFAIGGALIYILGSMTVGRSIRRGPGRVQELVRRAIDRSTRPFQSSPRTLAHSFILFAYASFGFVYVQFSDLIDAFMGISGKEPGRRSGFAVLSPACETHHDNYYMAFTLLTLALGFCLIRVLRRLKGEATLSTIVALGVGTAIALSMALLVAPYRLLTHNESPRIEFEGNPAYIVGRKDPNVLLFIPTESIPKKHLVPADRLPANGEHRIENVFALYSDTLLCNSERSTP